MSRRGRVVSPAILYADAELVALDKPAGFAAGGAHSGAADALDWLRGQPGFRPAEPLLPWYRLDQGASGVLVCARTRAAHDTLSDQFRAGTAELVYGALVGGYVDGDGEINLPLHFDRRSHRVESTGGRGEPALTRYRIVQRVAGSTWLECRPATDRMHQMRAHLAAIGHPLSVDPMYGGGNVVLLSHYKPGYHPNRRDEERPLIDRLTLHLLRVTFAHPAGGEPQRFEAPLPRDLRATLRQLGGLK